MLHSKTSAHVNNSLSSGSAVGALAHASNERIERKAIMRKIMAIAIFSLAASPAMAQTYYAERDVTLNWNH